MRLTAVKTDLITSGSHELLSLIDSSLPETIHDNSIICVAAKVVSLCENRSIPQLSTDKDDLIRAEAECYTDRSESEYNISFTIIQGVLIPTAGIDESNANDEFILWPKDPQATANRVREHLVERHGVLNIGVIITDSTSRPMQRGTTGICLAHSGFRALKNYIGIEDLFGRVMKVQCSNVAQGLAASAVMLMGEGREQTPIVLASDVKNFEFTGQNPSQEELAEIKVTLEDDLFRPLMRNAPWIRSEK